MPGIVIIGAGAHGREIAEILTANRAQVVGFVDDDSGLHHQTIDDVPVLGDWRWFESIDPNEVSVICGSGFSETRKRMVDRAVELGLQFASAVSPLAYVSPRAQLATGVVIYPSAVVCRGAALGDHAVINAGAVISHDAKIGAHVTINPGVNVAGNVTVGEGCYLGIGCNLIQGVTIGEWTTVGAGAAVIRDLPPRVTAVGVPANIIKGESKSL